MKRMHEAGVAHWDLHDENVCVLLGEERARTELIDLGLGHFEAEPNLEEYKQNDLDVFAHPGDEEARLSVQRARGRGRGGG